MAHRRSLPMDARPIRHLSLEAEQEPPTAGPELSKFRAQARGAIKKSLEQPFFQGLAGEAGVLFSVDSSTASAAAPATTKVPPMTNAGLIASRCVGGWLIASPTN